MKLEDLTAEIRPRDPWEAMDLGVALVRRDWKRITQAWCLTVVPFCLLLAFLLYQYPYLLLFAIFWFKPLYDRVPLFIISRSLFGACPRLHDLWRSPKFFLTDLLGSLSWRRFSLARSYVMPVSILEQLKGKARRQRLLVLGRETDAHGTSLMTVCALLEFAVAAALAMLLVTFIPSHSFDFGEWFLATFQDHAAAPDNVLRLLALIYFLALSFVEPFYVGAGFGLYINARTKGEGWDLDIAFRKLETRLSHRAASRGKVAAVALALFYMVSPTPTSHAQEAPTISDTKTQIREVLDRPEFIIHKTERTVWRRKGQPSEFGSPGPNVGMPFFALLGEVLFWVAIVAAVLAIAYWLYQYRHLLKGGCLRRGSSDIGPRATTVMGMDVRGDSLPDNIAQSAWEAWIAGRPQEAMSLLYRGSISWLIERERLPIAESDTENDCLQHAHQLENVAMLDYFSRLTAQWITGAYGKRWPTDETVKELCQSWPFHQGGPA